MKFIAWLFLLALALVALAVGLGSSQALAAGMCGAHDDFKAALNGKYEEQRALAGIVFKTSLVEIFKTKSGSTWTILLTSPEGRTCIIAAGEDMVEFVIENRGEKL